MEWNGTAVKEENMMVGTKEFSISNAGELILKSIERGEGGWKRNASPAVPLGFLFCTIASRF